jgi:ubiquitin C-terminal hydrolase
MKISVFPNLGNTCYLNSVLQCFINNSTFQELIKNYDLPFVNELKKIIVDLTDNDQYIAQPFNLSSLCEYFSFRKFEQQDAHECIILFLELLIKNCPYQTKILNEDNSWDKFDTSPFVPIYHGQTKNCIKCLKCKTVKNVFEEYNSINLNVPLEKSNLTDLFLKYLEKEVHNDTANLYYCETCKNNEVCEKKISLYRLPKILIIVLKRYTFTGSKIVSEVTFEPKIKIRESLSNDIKDYHLQSIINHTGNLYNGHYTNYTIINGKCLFIDDESIKLSNYNHRDSYVLFYEVK